MTDAGKPELPPRPPKPKRCPHCGEMNPRAADWCWVCYGDLSASGDNPDRGNVARPPDRRLKRSRVWNAVFGTLATVATTIAVFAVGVLLTIVAAMAALFEFCSELVTH